MTLARRWCLTAPFACSLAACHEAMQGLFIANGPRIRRGLKFKPFENIHVDEFMCAVLGLKPATNDGNPAVTRDMLRSSQ
jgi:hypothetical protein